MKAGWGRRSHCGWDGWIPGVEYNGQDVIGEAERQAMGLVADISTLAQSRVLIPQVVLVFLQYEGKSIFF